MNNNKKGVTLIELVAVLFIVALLLFSSSFFIPFIKLLFFPPKQTETVYYSNLITSYLVERNPYFSGLRYAKKIISAKEFYLRYKDPGNKDIALSFNLLTCQIEYAVAAQGIFPAPLPLVPDAVEKGIKINPSNPNDPIFRYLDAAGNVLPPPVANPGLVKQIELNWLVYSGQGNPQNGDGKVEVNTAVEINQVE